MGRFLLGTEVPIPEVVPDPLPGFLHRPRDADSPHSCLVNAFVPKRINVYMSKHRHLFSFVTIGNVSAFLKRAISLFGLAKW